MICTCRTPDDLCPECMGEVSRDDLAAVTEMLSEEAERRGEDG